MKIQDFKKHRDWIKVWSGRWSLYTDTNFSLLWTSEEKILGRPVYDQVIYTYQQGISDCWVSQAAKNNLGQRLLKVHNTLAQVKKLAAKTKSSADAVLSFINSYASKKINASDYELFWQLVGAYYLPHLSIKYLVDYLSPAQLKKFLPVLEDARLYAEPVFRKSEDFVEARAAIIAKESGYRLEHILALSRQELRQYFTTKRLPDKKILINRYKSSLILGEAGQEKIIVGDQAKKNANMLSASVDINSIKGNTAYPGKATGLVRVILDPIKDGRNFKQGEILVTGMTRPEFLSIVKKSAAFITDAGGILSHAAIVARELRKPCVIGTGSATKILKTGDLVSVDAGAGVIKRLSK